MSGIRGFGQSVNGQSPSVDKRSFRVHIPSRQLVIPDEPTVAAVIPHSRIIKNGRAYLALPHAIDTTRILRNIGYEVPSPILTEYNWSNVTPFEVQRYTAAFLTLNQRAYVLNALGTGKTLSALFAFDYLRMVGAAHKMLVLAPLSTLTTVWVREVFSRMPHLETAVVHGTRKQRLQALSQDVDIYILNHDGLKALTSGKSLIPELVQRKDIDVVLLDELAVLRTKRTERWRLANELVRGRRWVWGMTGGPTPHEPTDAWAQAKLITPETTPHSFRDFRDATMEQLTQFKWRPKRTAQDTVYALMQPAVRFTREQCVDLPPTLYSERHAALTPEQAKAYKRMLDDFVISHPKGTITAVNAAVQVGKLLQICTGRVYTSEHATAELDASTRLSVLHELIDESEGKIIVFVPFRHTVKLLEGYLAKHFPIGVVTGETSKKERDTIFTSFQYSYAPRVLVAHPKVMAHGLTLTAASTIVWFAPYPDYEVYEQANGRITRPGQVYHTHIIHISGTPVERKIYKTLQERGNLQAAILGLFEQELDDGDV